MNAPSDPIFEEYVNLFAYNPQTGQVTNAVRRGHTAKAGARAGGLDPGGYLRIKHKRTTIMAHRLAWRIHFGEWPNQLIDHINGIKSDNRISNLRVASKSQNNWNRKLNKNSSSGVKGVSWRKNEKAWRARIHIKGKCVHNSRHETKEGAETAVINARALLHGSFARN